uniref:Putative secreted protein n=1 Tax=Anopheles darlingi TaxID=43151 RepID=A0A2M4D757_ANODA
MFVLLRANLLGTVLTKPHLQIPIEGTIPMVIPFAQLRSQTIIPVACDVEHMVLTVLPETKDVFQLITLLVLECFEVKDWCISFCIVRIRYDVGQHAGLTVQIGTTKRANQGIAEQVQEEIRFSSHGQLRWIFKGHRYEQHMPGDQLDAAFDEIEVHSKLGMLEELRCRRQHMSWITAPK